MVKSIEVRDDKNYVLLTAGALNDLETLRAVVPRSPSEFRPKNFSFDCPEEATAWLLTAYSRRLLYFRRHGDAALELPLHTWVLGKPRAASAMLSVFFASRPAQTDRRVVVHRAPLQYGTRTVPPCWLGVYRTKQGVLRYRDHLSHDEQTVASDFLERVLDRYRGGTESVRQSMNETGHPVWMSSAPPDLSDASNR